MFDKKEGLSYTSEFISLDDLTSVDENDQTYLKSLLSQVTELEIKLRHQQDLIHSLEKDASTDPLTGLVNRRVFESELHKSLSFVKRYKRKSAVLFLDIDAFKSINDQFGHLAGDHSLTHIAKLLQSNVRPTDIVARIGGDEFCIILNEVKSERDVNNRTEILESVIASTPLMFNDRTVQLTVSIGARTFGADDSYEGIMEDADSVMYKNKNSKT